MRGIAAVTLVGSKKLAAYAEAELDGAPVSDAATPCRNRARASAMTAPHRYVVLACTHYPLLIDRLRQLAPGR